MNKLLIHMMNAGDIDHRVLPGLQKMQKAGQVSRFFTSPLQKDFSSNDNIPSPASIRTKIQNDFIVRQDLAKRNALQAARDRQGYIRQAEAPQSTDSKAWSIITNPMTALAYKVKGKDIPDHLERGPKNSLDLAANIINPFFYMNEGKEFGKGVGNIAYKGVTDPFSLSGMDFIETAMHGVGAIPFIAEGVQGANLLSNGVRGATRAYKGTARMTSKLGRVRNAVNSGAIELGYMPGDVGSHSYFNIPADEVSKMMSKEMGSLPKGAYTFDGSMSKNSAPLFWTQAARSPKGFTVVNPGTTQELNWSGNMGKRLRNALPENIENIMPDGASYAQDLKNRIDYLKNMGDAQSLAKASQLEREGISSQIISDLPYAAQTDYNVKNSFNQFLNNYKPTLDNPIIDVNRKTGLNFPMTRIVDENIGKSISGFYEQPSVYMVKGNPLSRVPKIIDNYIKNRADKFYFGNKYQNPRMPFIQTNTAYNAPKYIRNNDEYEMGGPIVDPRGQWAHPGKVTRIPSSNITMEGVPYPVLGVASSGQQVMMQPGQNYNFGDAEYVDEYPMMQNGGGLLSKTVSCSNCGWSWKAVDGGSDPLSCHKCGGTVKMQGGGQASMDSVRHQANKILQYEQLRGGPGGAPLPQYSNPKYMDMLMGKVYPEVKKIMPNASAMEAGEAMDFVFNAGFDQGSNKITKDPRAFALQEYYRQNDPSKLDADGKWAGRKNAPYSFDQEYNNTIGKLPENQRRILMNKGRDWYYKNINNPAPGVPNSNYNDTWYGRIWNTNDYQPFNPNNPNFTPKKEQGGEASLWDMIKMAEGGFLQRAQDGRTIRAANGEFSCAANPRSDLRASAASVSGGSNDPLHDAKNDYWARIKEDWQSQGVNKESFNNMYEDSLRAGPAFENPISAQYFDPSTGKARPGTPGRLKYYNEAGFPLGSRLTLEQIKNTALQQPNGIKGYNKLVKEDYPWGSSPFIPTKKSGGQMMQRGGTAYIDSVLNANKDLNWVKRLYEMNPQTIQIPGQKGTSTHFMESGDGRVYPTVVQMPNGQLQYLGDKAGDYADSTKTYIQFPNDKQATRFGKMYKKGTGVLSGFKNGGQHGGLDRWFAEKWVDVKTGKDCGRQEGESRAGYPACRPSKRINSQTPKTSSEMSSAEKAKFKSSKTSSQRIDYNHKRNK